MSRENNAMQKRYPTPNLKDLRNFFGMAFSLLVLHWAPDVISWIYANWLNEIIVINQRRYRGVLIVAYVITGVVSVLWIVGACYATWQNRKLEREEQGRN
jgi:hypothetical protein